jgi:hypothetical protein
MEDRTRFGNIVVIDNSMRQHDNAMLVARQPV